MVKTTPKTKVSRKAAISTTTKAAESFSVSDDLTKVPAPKVAVSKLKKKCEVRSCTEVLDETARLLKNLENTANLEERKRRVLALKAKQEIKINDLQKKLTAIKKHPNQKKEEAAIVGIIQLDDGEGNYEPHAGDVVSEKTFSFRTMKVVCKGLTLEVAKQALARVKAGQPATIKPHIKKALQHCVEQLENANVVGITADSGFLQYYQEFVTGMTSLPVFLSSLMQCSALACAYQSDEVILVVTADSRIIDKPTLDLLLDRCHLTEEALSRFEILGCEDVPEVRAFINGEDSSLVAVQHALIDHIKAAMRKYDKNTTAILLENTELPTFGDAIRDELGVTVCDAVTLINWFHSSVSENPLTKGKSE
eukprot:TRINITY_DN2195_c2_g3_i1.p1 TRINITY_DN2195_c2_g3~~TRINITY_DN2195_c2_g3_i1.p1  ORF type:complete len:376 (+),score=79.21 TRINITY_DN2195_c2_g3_i1:33-1130(+)